MFFYAKCSLINKVFARLVYSYGQRRKCLKITSFMLFLYKPNNYRKLICPVCSRAAFLISLNLDRRLQQLLIQAGNLAIATSTLQICSIVPGTVFQLPDFSVRIQVRVKSMVGGAIFISISWPTRSSPGCMSHGNAGLSNSRRLLKQKRLHSGPVSTRLT